MKLVPLSQGYSAKVDDSDYDRVSKYKWHVQISKTGRKCALRNYWTGNRSIGRKCHVILMHRFIVNAPSEKEVDHRDLDALNNRRSNLRITDSAGNRQNRPVRRDSSSQLKGVRHMESGAWRARIRMNGRMKNLGDFDLKEDAAKAYDQAARRLYGEFSRTNFNDRSLVVKPPSKRGHRKARCASGLKGVRAMGPSWDARITVDGRERHLGTFCSKEEAAKAYDREAKKAYGKFARTNF